METVVDSTAEDSIARERTATLYRNAPIGVVASSLMGIIAAAALTWDDPTLIGSAALWSALLLGCMIFHLGLCQAFTRQGDPRPDVWNRLFVLAALLEGLTWGLGAVLFSSPTHYYRQIIMLVLSSGLVASTAFVLSTQLAPFRAFFYPAIGPQLVVQLLYPYPLHVLAEAATVAFILSVSIATQRTTAQVVDVLRLRFRNEALARDLQVQKDRAEAANLAKSRFLAAASHDLRQPVHALGMFVGALRTHQADPATRQILDHIDGSVTALDDLFTALLDISKLDAGVLEAHLADTAIDPILARICAEHEAEARAKGLVIRRVPSSLAARTDPVLLERVVRNLVSNAIKYSDVGRLLVGCRRKDARVAVVVADTGRGVSEADAQRIFEEFFQVSNPERDRAQGLGLGLAIVRRVLPLIEGEVQFSSTLGRGSVFRIELPRAHAPSLPRTEPGAEIVSAPVAPSTPVILVLDDEADVLSGMSLLLDGWGYKTVSGGSAAELLDAVARQPEPPRVMISDYRLRGDETGIAAIAQVRRALGREIPALLITGDTAPDRLAEARDSGLTILHKPVPPSRLRAVLGNLLRTAPDHAI